MKTPDLSGLIKAKPRRRQQPDPAFQTQPAAAAAPQPVPVPDQPDDTTRAAETTVNRTHTASASTTPAAPETPGTTPARRYTRSISLYLPRSIHIALTQRATDSGQTRTAIILRSVNRHHRELGEWLDSEGEPTAADGLFDVPQEARAAEPVVQTAIRVTDAQLAAMDDLASKLEVRRSHVMVAALRAELAPLRQSALASDG